MSYKTLEIPNIPFKISAAVKMFEQCFSNQCKMVSENDGEKLSRKMLLKTYEPFITYVFKYYYETAKGHYLFYDVETKNFDYKTKEDFKNEVCEKMNNDGCYKNFFGTNTNIFKVCAKFNRPRLYEENDMYYLNECHGFLHQKYKAYEEYDETTKKRVNIILDMIKEISCNNNEDFFEAYVKYLSQLCKGEKTEVIIYKKSEQGTGKSTETDFLMNYVLGTDICLISGTEPLLTNVNKILLGKLLVIFEELPTFSDHQWSSVSSKLKTLATEKLTMYRGLFKDPIQAENISNFVINTNCESIKDSDGRRIIIMPINTSRIGDFKYFKNIRDKCFNLEIGEAFFSYLMSINTKSFYAQDPENGFPETDQKRNAISKLLPSYYKFLKFEYVLKKKDLDKIKPKDLHDYYKEYCIHNNLKAVGKNDFIQFLEKINIEVGPKNNGYFYYKVSYETLKAISDKRKWVCDYDYLDIEDEFVDEEEGEKIKDYKRAYEKLLRKYEELKKKTGIN